MSFTCKCFDFLCTLKRRLGCEEGADQRPSLHLLTELSGDYIYEYAGDGDYGYGGSIGRIPKPERIIYTLNDYRERHATYRSDLDLQLSHASFPWIPVWDDHEV